jgi:electron transfer flavoprotein beta subunit
LALKSTDEHRRPRRGQRELSFASRVSGAPRYSTAAMKIAVCVKEVPDTSASKRIDPETLRLDRSGEGALNLGDTNAIEAALRIKESSTDCEVVLISMGPESAINSLRKGLAMGADRAALVSDSGAEGSDIVGTTNVLAAVLASEAPDLTLFGQQSADSDGAVLWAAVADRLQQPFMSQATNLELESGNAKVKRQTEYGYDLIEAPLPCVVAVSDGINEPRYPSLKGIMGAKKKPQEILGLDSIGVSAEETGTAGSRTEVRALNDPPARGDSQVIEADGEAAARLLAFLNEKKLI